jgi:hypothetical protein
MAEAPDEPLIDPSPPPEEKRRNWRVRRLVFYGFLGVWAVVALWNLFKPMPDGTRIRGEVVDTPLEQLEFLSDVSGADVFGAPVVRQQIFDAMLATIREARQYIVVDVFLFNGQRGSLVDTPPPRALSAELRDALLARKREMPGLMVLVINDPINNVYGSLPSQDLAALRDAGIEVVDIDLDSLRDSNFIYSAFWRLTLKWWTGSGKGDAWLPNPLDDGPRPGEPGRLGATAQFQGQSPQGAARRRRPRRTRRHRHFGECTRRQQPALQCRAAVARRGAAAPAG